MGAVKENLLEVLDGFEPVVMCKDCRHYGNEGCDYWSYDDGVVVHNWKVEPFGFCKWGELREDATQHTHSCPCGARKTCEVTSCEEFDERGIWAIELSCGHADVFCVKQPGYCSCCGATVVYKW